MLTYFGLVVKLPARYRFEADPLRDSAALAVPLSSRESRASLTQLMRLNDASQGAAQTIAGLRFRCKSPTAAQTTARIGNSDAREAMPWQCPSTNGLI